MYRPSVAWLTGLSGSGKSTIAQAFQCHCNARQRSCVVLDGDAVRGTLCRDLGFSPADRAENVRRVAEFARIVVDQTDTLVVVALISPFAEDRLRARQIIGDARMLEVHVSTPLALCEARDAKGLYRRARAKEIAEFTGISSPYEAPAKPDLVLDTALLSVDDCVCRLHEALLGTQGAVLRRVR